MCSWDGCCTERVVTRDASGLRAEKHEDSGNVSATVLAGAFPEVAIQIGNAAVKAGPIVVRVQ